MKVLIVAPADESRRFKHDLPAKGSRFFRRPNYDILRLSALIVPQDELTYIDERVEELDLDRPFDVILVYADFDLESRAVEIATAFQRRGQRVVVFGPMANILPQTLSNKVYTVVVGDMNNIWPSIRTDVAMDKLQRFYTAQRTPRYTPPEWELGRKPGFEKQFQAVQAVLGCFCPQVVKHLCPQFLYYGDNTHIRPLPEVIGEILSLPLKQVFFLDDDVAHNPDYYYRLFSQAWSFRKEWFVQAGPSIFDCPELLKLLPKAGVRVIFLNEDWLTDDGIFQACQNRSYFLKKHREIQLLHSLKMLVGVRLVLKRREGSLDFRGLSKCFYRLGFDFLELRVFAPISKKPGQSPIGDRFSTKDFMFWPEVFPPTQFPTGFLWLKDQFYSFNSIFDRSIRTITRVGIYTTFRYFFLMNLAYRQNYLEGIPYPP